MLEIIELTGNVWRHSLGLRTATFLVVILSIFCLTLRLWVCYEQYWIKSQKNQSNKQNTRKKKLFLNHRQQLVSQMPLFLQALSNAMQAGYTLPMALHFIATEIEEPLKSEIQNLNQKLNLQVPLENALADFANKAKDPEVNFFVESAIIQHRTGGNLVKLFNKVAFLIEEKLKLKRDVRSFTSQGKLSGGLIALLWPISLFIFTWLSPSHTEVLFQTTAGQSMLFISLLLELIGFFFIWKIITVKL